MKFMESIKKNAEKAGTAVRAKKPEILLISGIVMGVGALVMASRAILKVEPVLDDAKAEKERLEGYREAGEITFTVDAAQEVEQTIIFDETDYRKAMWKLWIKTAGQIAKIYGISFAMALASLLSFVGCYKTLKNENTSLKEYSGALLAAYNACRQKMDDSGIDIFESGKDEIETVQVNSKGKEEKIKENVAYFEEDLYKYSPNARYFRRYDPETGTGSRNAEGDIEYDVAYIRRMIQNFGVDYNVEGGYDLYHFWKNLGYPCNTKKDKMERDLGWAKGHPKSLGSIQVDVRIVRRKVTDYNESGDPVFKYEDWIVIDPKIDGFITGYMFKDGVKEPDPNEGCPF